MQVCHGRRRMGYVRSMCASHTYYTYIYVIYHGRYLIVGFDEITTLASFSGRDEDATKTLYKMITRKHS